MSHEADVIRHGMRTPRAAAIAGIVFSLLLMGSMLLIKTSIPPDPLAGAADVINHSKRIALALNMLPFAGISFLWFVGVLRDRMGKLEDRFFATVFLGSALLFLAMIFAAGAVAAGIIRLLASGGESLMGPGVYALGRIGIYQVMHVYAIRMAGVFMISTSTISLRTRIAPRWMAFLGFVLALMLLLSNGTINGILMVFPLWVLLISVHILIDNLRGAPSIPM
jgi:hypothetical protein